MSLECGECECDLRGGHDPKCSRARKKVGREYICDCDPKQAKVCMRTESKSGSPPRGCRRALSEQLVRGWYEAIKGMETSDMDAKLIAQRRVVDFERKLMSWAASHSEKVNSPLCPWCGGEHVGTDCKAEKANALGK